MVIDPSTGKTSIIDWGEVTISHALWPVAGFLKKLCWRYKLQADSDIYRGLRAAFLEDWGIAEEDMDAVVKNISLLDCIYYALSLDALEKNTGAVSDVWASRIQMSLDAFINEAVARP